jgi:long-subunit fatty acid transport protein
MFKINDVIALGASYTSTQVFEEFEWNSVYKNPNLPNFGQARVYKFQMDAPAVVAGGLGLNPLPGLSLAGDVKYIMYSSTEGFEKSGFDQTWKVLGFGWEDIMVIAVGGEYWVTEVPHSGPATTTARTRSRTSRASSTSRRRRSCRTTSPSASA